MYRKSHALQDLLHKGRVERQIQHKAGSIVLDGPSVLQLKLWKLYKCYRSLPYAVWPVTWPNASTAPWCHHVHAQCMVLSWRVRHHGKNKAIKATKMSILDPGPYMFGDVEQQIGWFQSKGLLATSKTYPACSQPMNMQTRSDVTDKYRYVCNNSVKCKCLD